MTGNNTRTAAIILVECLRENPVRTVQRELLRKRWLLIHPEQDRTKIGRVKGRLTSVGGYYRQKLNQGLRDLETRGVIIRSKDTVKVVDISLLVQIADIK